MELKGKALFVLSQSGSDRSREILEAVDKGQQHPELAMKALDAVERKHAPPEDIYHVVERYTSCGIGICGKCSICSGERTCVDGPVYSAAEFTPGEPHRDLTGKKVGWE